MSDLPDAILSILESYPQFKSKDVRIFKSPLYNYVFNPENGAFIRWGLTADDNPVFSPQGPELLDIEISTICGGVSGKNCEFCYKNNTKIGKNMSLGQFVQLFAKFPENVMQIAFGIGDINGNPDLIPIMEYCRHNPRFPVVPNITINGDSLDECWAQILSKLCGSVAVSNYDRDICNDAVALLTKSGCKQVNIHQMVSEESFATSLELVEDLISDSRLQGIYSVVFLALKQKGRGRVFTPISDPHFEILVKKCLQSDINIGFDTCSAHKVLDLMKNHSKFPQIESHIESCESGLFSGYINVEGQFSPCSFLEDSSVFQRGIDVFACKNFLEDVWEHINVKNFRKRILASAQKNQFGCRTCPLYKI